MGNFFANPALLWGGLAIAAPIAIFLLTRYRFRTVEWAALEFLARAFKRQQRRLRLENLLLLLIRCLIILLFALALARPRAQARVAVNKDDVRRNVVLVIDTSFSTAYQIGSDETAYERERRAAIELVSALEDGDRVMVVGFDDTAHVLYPVPKQMNEQGKKDLLLLLDDAHELRRSARGTDLGEALHDLPGVLQRFDFGPDGQPPPEGAPPLKKTVFLLTDAQRRGLLDDAGALRDSSLQRVAREVEELGGGLVLIDCGAEEPKNVSVARLATRETIVGTDLPCHIEASVRNWSTLDITDLQVEYYVDGATTPQKVVSLSVPAGEERTPDPLRYVFTDPGYHRVELVLKSDGLLVDNERHLVVDVRQNVRALLVDGERVREAWNSETDFLRVALGLSTHPTDERLGLIQPEVVDESALAGLNLSDYDVVALCNVVSLREDVVAALEAYARGGGTVLFTLGGLVDGDAYNQNAWREGAGILPCKLVARRGGTREEAQRDEGAPEWAMAVRDRSHPVASMFEDPEMLTHLKMPSIFGFFLAEPAAQRPGVPGASVPLVLVPRGTELEPRDAPREDAARAGLPLVVEKPYGRGRAVVWLSTVDQNWNNCVVYDGFFVPFWRQMTLHLAQRSRPEVNLEVGGVYERVLQADQYSASTQVLNPEGQHEGVVLEKLEGDELYRLTYPPVFAAAAPADGGGEAPAEEERGAGRLTLEIPGIYTVTRKGVAGATTDPEPDYFAVRVDAAEGDLTKYTAEELQGALGVPVRGVPLQAAQEALRVDGGPSGAREFWRWALAGVVALMGLESVLAAAFGRRRR